VRQALQNVLMPQMHAVKIADCYRAGWQIQRVFAQANLHKTQFRMQKWHYFNDFIGWLKCLL
jgi:hypothetical protein